MAVFLPNMPRADYKSPPVETYQAIFDKLVLKDLAAARILNKEWDRIILSVLEQRYKTLFFHFLSSSSEYEELKGILKCGNGAMLGSAAVWFNDPNYNVMPNDIDFVVPKGGGDELVRFFKKIG